MAKSVNSTHSKKYQRIQLTVSVTEFILGLAFLILILSTGLTLRLEDLIRNSIQNDYLVLLAFTVLIGIMEGVLLFPLSILSGFIIEHRFGLTDQRLGSWLWERIKSLLVSTPLMLVIIIIFYALLRRFPETWWFYLGSIMVLFAIVLARVAPVLIFPIFYKFTPLENLSLTEKVADLCSRVGLKLEGVYQFNLSKTTRKANAAFTGIGKSKRVILGDTLLNNMNDEEILAVLSHELGHYKLKHIWKGMLVGTLLTFLGLFLVGQLYDISRNLFGFESPEQIAALPLIAILLTIYQLVTAPLMNAYSRSNERAADDFAIKLTGNAAAFISGLNKLAQQNLADRTPHPLVEFLFYSHPPIEKRIKRLSAT